MASQPTLDLTVTGRPDSSAMQWFAERGFDTWTVDHEGYGRSSKHRDINCDISNAAVPLPAGTTREQLLARFHVQGRDGQLLSGAQAFLALWTALPGWRWLAMIGRLLGAGWVMERMYRLFLRWRPTIRRWALQLNLA